MWKLTLLFYCLWFSQISQIFCQTGSGQTDVTVVLGASGSGKSTFIQWIAGDNTDLISKETFPDSGEYLIEDIKDKIGFSPISKTPFPELVVDELTGSTFYEFPAFSETRNSSQDMAALLSMKSMMNNIENVKMLFLISYSDVQGCMDKTEFPELLMNIDNLFGDVEKFENSIALVVSQVDNTYIKQGTTFILKPDSAVIREIANFFLKTRETFEEDLDKPVIRDNELRRFRTNAIKIINILLTQEGGEYTSIKLFRRPDEDGPLSEIALLTKGKVNVQRMLSENLRFTQISSSVTAINDQVTIIIDGILATIQEYLENLMASVRVTIYDSNLEALNLTQALEFSIQADNGLKVLADAVDYFTNLSGIDGLGEKLSIYLSNLNMEVPESMVQDLSKVSKYFEFFQLFRKDPLPVSSLDWTKSFQSALTYLTESKQSIKDKASSLAKDISSQINSDVDFIADSVRASFIDYVNRMDKTVRSLVNNSSPVQVDPIEARLFSEKFVVGEKVLTALVKSLKLLPKLQLLSYEISEALSSMNYLLPNDVLSRITEKSQAFDILEKVSVTNFTFQSAQWSNSIKTVVTYIQTQNIITLATNTAGMVATNVDTLLETLNEKIRSIAGKKQSELEVKDVGDELKKWYSFFASIRGSLTAKTTLKQLIDAISSSLSELGVNEQSIRDNLRSLEEQENYLSFLKAVQGEVSDVILTTKWKSYIGEIVEFLNVDVNFDSFVLALYDTLSQYKVQNDVSRYDVRYLTDWGKNLSQQGIHIDKNNLKLFLEKVKEFYMPATSKISNIVPSESQLKVLNNVLKTTLQQRVTIQCPSASDSTVILKANFIKFSDFLDLNGKFKGCGWTNISALEIYSLNGLFIDQDLDALGEKLKLSIVAPKWEVIGISRKIRLDGENGELLPRAANGFLPGDHGKNGSAGMTGGPGGAFFGVGNEFVRSERLTISANGGNGGSGQSGGIGANGQDGKTPPAMNELSVNCDTTAYVKLGFRVVAGVSGGCGFASCRNDKVYGQSGTNGGNAGSCGVGGLSGLPGEISVISLTGSSNLKVLKSATQGKNGANGLSGGVGLGGKHGSNRKVSCRKGWFGQWSLESSTLETNGTATRGIASSGCNPNIPAKPLPAATIQNAASFLRNFVSFFIENSNERFVRFSTIEIYEQINSNQVSRDLQVTLGLIEDMEMLESFSRESNLNLIPFYESHLANIENYAADPKPTERSGEFKKVLSYLYTASLAQMSNLKKNQDSDLVIDIGGYLDIVSKNVERLSNLQDESRLFTAVETIKDNFKNELDMKIEEAHGLIKDILIPEIESIDSQFDVQISGLVNEVISLQNAAVNEIEKTKAALIEKKKELEKAMVANTILNVFNAVGKVISLFGAEGKAVGEGIKSVTTVAEALIQVSLKLQSSQSVIDELQRSGNEALKLSVSIKRDEDDIATMTQGVKDLEETVNVLNNFEAKIFEKLLPMIEKMGKDLINTANDLKSKSRVSLDVASWQVQGTLRDTSFEIQQFTRGFEVHESVAKLADKLEEVMAVMIKVYDRIQDYQEQQRLATYMADLSSAPVSQIDVSNPLINDGFRNLQISIRRNILLSQYNSVLNAFKQWIFPFAETFLKDFQLPESLVTNKTDIEALASTASSRIEDIRSSIQKYKTTIEAFDQHIFSAVFNSNSKVMKPFYVWKNKKNRDMITKLLAGETVLVKADVTKSATDKDAIKFNFIELGFKSDNSSIQANVDKKLLNFVASMTHLGNSYYRYNGQYFSIASPSQSLQYSFEKGSIENNIGTKLRLGDIVLSPYAMWELKLTHKTKGQSFDSLSKFCDKVDLVLEGKGSFVKTGLTKLNPASYYKVEESSRFTSV